MPRGHDVETRERVLTAAARLFAERGHAHVTIRDICAIARANIAAVNYHFSTKDDLYQEVLARSVSAMRAVTVEAIEAGHGLGTEDRLRAFIRVFLTRTLTDDDAWVHQLLLREVSEPTAALDRLVDDVVRPRLAYLREIAAELLGCPVHDARTARCAFSVHAQCMALTSRSLTERVSPSTGADSNLRDHVDHITEFSLAGLWALARTT